MKKPSINFKASFDCTQRQIVVDIATTIYRSHGYEIKDKPIGYLFESQHPTERAVLAAAEEIFELFAGDSPSYDDDDDDESLAPREAIEPEDVICGWPVKIGAGENLQRPHGKWMARASTRKEY